MKKILVVILLIISAAPCLHAQQVWVTHTADNHVSVKFPLQPKETSPGTFSVRKDSVVYVFTTVNLVNSSGMTSEQLATNKELPEFVTGLKEGLSGSMPGVTLSDLQIGKYKSNTSYTTSGSDTKGRRYDFFMFIIGDEFYSLTTVTAKSAPLSGRDKFFASIQITP